MKPGIKNQAILLGNSERTIQRWKDEKRPITQLLDVYFNDESIVEFLKTGKIQQLEEFLNFQKTKDTDPEFQLFKEYQAFQEFKQTSDAEKVADLASATSPTQHKIQG